MMRYIVTSIVAAMIVIPTAHAGYTIDSPDQGDVFVKGATIAATGLGDGEFNSGGQPVPYTFVSRFVQPGPPGPEGEDTYITFDSESGSSLYIGGNQFDWTADFDAIENTTNGIIQIREAHSGNWDSATSLLGITVQ